MSESFILIGVLLFVLVMLPVILLRDYRQKRKVRQIIESYRMQNKKESHRNNEESEDSHSESDDRSVPEGWGMNNSPFRDRKSGLKWGGGNIKASEAIRGTKRKFLS